MISTDILQPDFAPQTPLCYDNESSDLLNETEAVQVGEDEAHQHPLGVRPGGNALTSQENAQFSMGVFGRLPDALLVVLLEYLSQVDLVHLGSTCRGLYAYCSSDALWRDLAVSAMDKEFEWRGSWRSSLRRLPVPHTAHVNCRYLFSDALHRPFWCSQISLSPFVTNIPSRNDIPRLEDLSSTAFNEVWAERPFILTAPVKKWQIFETWNEADLLDRFGQTAFRAESVDWPLTTYVDYMNTTADESPLYLFDRAFVEKMGLQIGSKEPSMPNAYDPPEAFQEDLFTTLQEHRPDHRWLIVGPERSGSTFHKDPNATSAWNAVIRGSKYWIMFPSSIIPPGVYMSEDQSEVTSPLSIAEWLLSFHSEARSMPGCMEGICREGEVLHVPSGWWHLVVNLAPSIAITQNFVPRSHLAAAMRFLRDKPSQVSGFKDDVGNPYALFMERLQQTYPDLVVSVGESTIKKRKWEELVSLDNADEGREGFSFGFDDDIDEDEGL